MKKEIISDEVLFILIRGFVLFIAICAIESTVLYLISVFFKLIVDFIYFVYKSYLFGNHVIKDLENFSSRLYGLFMNNYYEVKRFTVVPAVVFSISSTAYALKIEDIELYSLAEIVFGFFSVFFYFTSGYFLFIFEHQISYIHLFGSAYIIARGIDNLMKSPRNSIFKKTITLVLSFIHFGKLSTHTYPVK